MNNDQIFKLCTGCINPHECAEIGRCIALVSPMEIAAMVKAAGPRQMTFEPHAQQVIESRESSHGDYRKQAATAQALKNCLRKARELTDWQYTPEQIESIEMICVKLSRITNGNPNVADHWTDIAGYATLISNLLTKGTHL